MLTTRHAGKQCAWNGFDGKLYAATIQSVKNGIATIVYSVNGREITAYIPPEHHSRAALFDGLHGG